MIATATSLGIGALTQGGPSIVNDAIGGIGSLLGLGNNREEKRNKRDHAKRYLRSVGVNVNAIDGGAWKSDDWQKYATWANRILKMKGAKRAQAIAHLNKKKTLSGFSYSPKSGGGASQSSGANTEGLIKTGLVGLGLWGLLK